MAVNLVIVESKTKAKTISRYLGKGFHVEASKGHVRDLPGDEFGVDVEDGFRPTYEILPDSRAIIQRLKKRCKGAEVVYLAADPDREGEAIAWHLKHALELPDDRVRRATFHEITKEAVREAFQSPRALDMNLINAQQARRILDRIVGYELSPLISRKIVRGLSAGRVQSVALRLICDREAEVLAFKSEEYWEIVAKLATEDGKAEFEAKLAKLNGDEVKIGSEAQASDTVASLRDASYVVKSADTRQKVSWPWPPFITSTLQRAASSRLGLSTDVTMREAQRLYEGVEIEGQSEGLITYMRTDSTRVSERAVESVRGLIEQTYGKAYLPEKPNTFKSPRGAQGAHEAIRPTDVARTPEKVQPYLTKRQFKLYELIWQRFVASQMKRALYKVTRAEIEAGAGLFTAQGRVTVFDGYTRVLVASKDKPEPVLPQLAVGQVLVLRDLEQSQHFTQPPPRYTEGSLVKEMEKRGIGRPSTYAPTISTLVKRNYVRRRRRTLFPTDLGMIVTAKLVSHFPTELDYGFTSDLEAKLDEIEEGTADWQATLRGFYDRFSEDLQRAKSEMRATKEDEEETGRTCEKCGKKMIVRFSRKGDKFLGCSGWPECDFTISLNREPVQESEHACPKCGAPMLIRTGRKGRPYLACSAYPKCRNIMGMDKDGKPVEMKAPVATGVACPKCQKPMVLRSGRRGSFLGCSGYPKCRSTMPIPDSLTPSPAEGKPVEKRPPVTVGLNCPKCQKPMVLRAGRRGSFLGCSGYPKCRSTMPIPDSLTPCPKAGCGGYVVEKVSPEGEKFYGCTRSPECDYRTDSPTRQ